MAVGGTRAIVCGNYPLLQQRCRVCRYNLATLECDGRIEGKAGGRCERPLCAGCALSEVGEHDFCPTCFAACRQITIEFPGGTA